MAGTGLASLRGDGVTGEGVELKGPVGVRGQTEGIVVASER